jgi:hypothetical protein
VTVQTQSYCTVALALIEAAAEAGEQAPSNDAIAEAIGAASVQSAIRVVHHLAERGLITVRRFHAARQITIVRTGKATRAPIGQTVHWRDRPDYRPKPRPKVPVPHSAGRVGDEPPLPAIMPPRRDPCPRCGVRGDHGCRHGWQP